MMPRPGAFAANFSPGTLNRFRDLCKQQGRQYTKVLERLAEVYVATNGGILDFPSVPDASRGSGSSSAQIDSSQFQDLLQRVEQLESEYRIADDHLEDLISSLEERVQLLEQ
jgi:hypothetical protein